MNLEYITNALISIKKTADEQNTELIYKISFINLQQYGGGEKLLCAGVNRLREEQMEIAKKRDADLKRVLNEAFYNLALMFSKKQTKGKIIMMEWVNCQLCCSSREDAGFSVKVYDRDTFSINSRVKLCYGCYSKIEDKKRTIICSSKILLVPHIIELPELRDIICENFRNIV
jgi:hypothetical protein